MLNKYSQKTKLCGLVPNFCIHISLWAIYIFPRSVRFFCCIAFADWSWEYINRSQIHKYINWERGRAVSFLEIFVSNFRCSAFAVQSLPLFYLRKTCDWAEIGTRTGFILPIKETVPCMMTAASSALPVLHLANPEIWLPEVEPEYRKLSLCPVLSLYLTLHPAFRSPPYLPKLLPISTL
jgi:hypothetical protein